jgi:hypothetical protein
VFRWAAVSVTLVLLAAVVSVSLVVDHSTRAQLRQTDDVLSRLELRTHQVLARIAVTEVDVTVARGQRSAAQAALGQANQELATTSARLSTARYVAGFETAQVQALSACLDGVQRALNALSVGDSADAVKSLTAVQTTCATAASNSG